MGLLRPPVHHREVPPEGACAAAGVSRARIAVSTSARTCFSGTWSWSIGPAKPAARGANGPGARGRSTDQVRLRGRRAGTRAGACRRRPGAVPIWAGTHDRVRNRASAEQLSSGREGLLDRSERPAGLSCDAAVGHACQPISDDGRPRRYAMIAGAGAGAVRRPSSSGSGTGSTSSPATRLPSPRSCRYVSPSPGVCSPPQWSLEHGAQVTVP